MHGIAVAKILKKEMPDLPIFMFTSFEEGDFWKQEVLASGIKQVISKTDSAELIRAVERASRVA